MQKGTCIWDLALQNTPFIGGFSLFITCYGMFFFLKQFFKNYKSV